jgi:hypothetical protein
MKLTLFAAISAATLCLVGCATTPVMTTEAKPVPRERVVAPDYLVPRAGSCLVIVKRDAGFLGVGDDRRLGAN